MPETTQEIIERVGLIPVLRAKSVAQGRAVVDAMIAGGVTVVEVTMTVPGAIDLLKELQERNTADELLLGSGTVTTADQARPPSMPARSLSSAPACILKSYPATKATTKSPAPARSRPPRPSPRGTPAPTT